MSHIAGSIDTRSSAGRPSARPATLIWIDSRQAFVVRWSGIAAKIERYESDVPVHRRSTGRDSSAPQDGVEGRRLEHLARFVESISARIPGHGDLFIIGPGTVHEQLAQHTQLADKHARRQRLVACHTAGPMTERQLIAELRADVGALAPRKKQTRRRMRTPPAEELPDPFAELEETVNDQTDRSR